MRLTSLLVSVVATLGLIVATQGCGDTDTKEERLCTPGAYVFCRCQNRVEGTKLCKEDGKSFEACTTSTSGECGGEVEDPRTNQPVAPPRRDGGDEPIQEESALDACPGKSTAVVPGVEVKLEGDTTGAKGDRQGRPGACAIGAGAKDHVYRLIPSGSGALVVDVQGADGLDPVVYLREKCDDEATQIACGPTTPKKVAHTQVNVLTGQEYYLVVDGASGSTGKYTATLKLTTGPFCGDGKVDSGEACDDKNKVDDDGCSNNCLRVDGDPPSGGSCPGHSVHLWQGKTVTGTGSNKGYGNTWNAPDQSCGTGTNKYTDHIYEITPHATGKLTVTVTPKTGTPLNLMLTARTTCTDPSTLGAGMCVNNESISDKAESMTLSVTNNKKVYVAVDGGGITGNAGEYSITFKLQ